jgi:hypothetical protein
MLSLLGLKAAATRKALTCIHVTPHGTYKCAHGWWKHITRRPTHR